MKTYSDLWEWVRTHKGREAADDLAQAWDGPKGDAQSAADTLSDVLFGGFIFGDVDQWHDLHDELVELEKAPSAEAWQITATFDGETHRLSGTGKLSFLQSLARLGVEADKITA